MKNRGRERIRPYFLGKNGDLAKARRGRTQKTGQDVPAAQLMEKKSQRDTPHEHHGRRRQGRDKDLPQLRNDRVGHPLPHDDAETDLRGYPQSRAIAVRHLEE